MFCINCGAKVPDHAKFCIHCGAKIQETITEDQKEAENTTAEAVDPGHIDAVWQQYQSTKNQDPDQSQVFLKEVIHAADTLEKKRNLGDALTWYKKLAGEYEKLANEATGNKIFEYRQIAICYFEKIHSYQPEASGHLGELYFLQGTAWELSGQDGQALARYAKGSKLGNLKAILAAAKLYGNPLKQVYDFRSAYSMFVKAYNNTSDKSTVRESWNQCKAMAPISDRIDCLVEAARKKLGWWYYCRKYNAAEISLPLENAMLQYGRQAEVYPDQVVLLCYISKNDEGFMITGDGDFISSDGVRVSLRDLSAVKFSNMQLIEPASGLVLLQYKDERTEPKKFCTLLNEWVLVDRGTRMPNRQPPKETMAAENTAARVCPNCGAAVEPSTKFCINCGSPLPAVEMKAKPAVRPESSGPNVCPNCGAVLNPGTKFCIHCGSPVQAAEPKVNPVVRSETPESNTCPYCGGVLNPGAKFCIHCGKPLMR